MKSMTGFSEVQKDYNGYSIKATIKSVNGKYLDCQIKGNEFSSPFENEIFNLIKKSINRGRVTVWTDIFIDNNDFIDVSINLSTVVPVLNELKKMKEQFPDFDYSVPISSFLAGSNYVKTELSEKVSPELGKNVEQVIALLLENFNQMREIEGKTLQHDMEDRVIKVKENLEKIENLRENFFKNQLNLYKDKLEKLLQTGEMDENRITMEAGILVDKLDISEEITRLNSHISLFLNTINSSKSIGKKLDFIIQEMFRETNTIGSKGKDKDIAFLIVEIKTELEKIREQVQNIE